MISQSTLNRLAIARARLAEVKEESIQNWQRLCNCSAPGQNIECLDCPYFRELVKSIQGKLDPNPAKVFTLLLPPEIEYPYSVEVQQQCIEMYVAGYSIQKIKYLTGANNRQMIAKLVKEAGLSRGTDEYYLEQKPRCIELYEQGLEPREVENETGVPANLVSDWVAAAGKSRPKKYFSEQQKQECLELYKQGEAVQDISKQTGIPKENIKTWVKRAKIHRPRTHFGKGIPIHSPETRDHCRQLLKQGKTPEQIEELVDINADTIRRWRKQWEQESSS